MSRLYTIVAKDEVGDEFFIEFDFPNMWQLIVIKDGTAVNQFVIGCNLIYERIDFVPETVFLTDDVALAKSVLPMVAGLSTFSAKIVEVDPEKVVKHVFVYTEHGFLTDAIFESDTPEDEPFFGDVSRAALIDKPSADKLCEKGAPDDLTCVQVSWELVLFLFIAKWFR
ncbi:MAG: hypothetical protein GY861_20910 [bacterium]|nr:hypothetical protein [bacterium]